MDIRYFACLLYSNYEWSIAKLKTNWTEVYAKVHGWLQKIVLLVCMAMVRDPQYEA